MAFATGSKSRLCFCPESVYGTLETNPVWTRIPYESFSPGYSKDELKSGKLRSDRNPPGSRHGNIKVAPSVKSKFEYGSFDTLLEAMLMGTWTTNVLKNGVTRRSFSLEQYLDMDTDEYHRYLGCEVNSLEISVKANSLVDISFGFVGKSLSLNTSAASGATYSSYTDKEEFDGFTGTISEGGSASAIITDMSIKIDNGMDPLFVIGSNTTVRPSEGFCNVTASITALYQSKALFEKFVNETLSALSVTLTDPSGSDLTIALPALKYSGGAPDTGGPKELTHTLPCTAEYSDSDAAVVVITRAA